jgi:hypothetical protein
MFETVSSGRVNPQAQVSKWQKLCGFRGPAPLPKAATPAYDPDDDHGATEGDPHDAMDDSVGPFGNPVDATPVAAIRRSGMNRTLT